MELVLHARLPSSQETQQSVRRALGFLEQKSCLEGIPMLSSVLPELRLTRYISRERAESDITQRRLRVAFSPSINEQRVGTTAATAHGRDSGQLLVHQREDTTTLR